MNDWINITMIVADQDVTLARQLCVAAAGESGADMLGRPCSADGALPATHWCSGGLIQTQFAALLGDAQATFDATGGAVPMEAIEAMYGRATFVEGDPLPALETAGLKTIEDAGSGSV